VAIGSKKMTKFLSSVSLVSSTALQYACALLLLVGMLPLPYSYYQVLRVIVCLASVFLAFKAIMQNETMLVAILLIIALIFNPVAPLYFKKDVWRIIDFVTAMVFVALGWKFMTKFKH
jgi:hypothetical protein